MISNKVYRAALYLSPEAFRREFSTEMTRCSGMRSRSHVSISGCLKWKKWPE